MAKYRGPRIRIVRRLGDLPAFTQKVRKENYRKRRPTTTPNKLTRFAHRLMEKQKLRFHYFISEKQIVRYIKSAQKAKRITSIAILIKIEMRLDNLIYRTGIATTLPFARQLVNHGHILVEHNRVDFPSFSCSQKQSIAVRESSRVYSDRKKRLYENTTNLPTHLTIEKESLVAFVNRNADRSEVPVNLKEFIVIEYYSNRL